MRESSVPHRRWRLPRVLWAGLALTCLGSNASAAAESYDLVIRRGQVMDPQSGFNAVADVAIRGDRIVAIAGQLPGGKREIDARGLVVAPGFIDLHAHEIDGETSRLHALDGVTTALELEIGVFPVATWYARRENRSIINYGASASHAVTRAIATGELDPAGLPGELQAAQARLGGRRAWAVEPLAPPQIERVKELLRQGLDEGGIGFGFHLAFTPGADRGELRALHSLSAERGVPNFMHMRSVGSATPIEAAQEVIAAARDTGASMHVMHINSSGLWETPTVLAMLKDAQRNGLDVTTDVYPYTAAHSTMGDPRTTRENLALFRADISDLQLAETGERLTEATFDLYKRTKPDAELLVHIMKQAHVDAAVSDPTVIIASDGGEFPGGMGHPRGAGAFSRVLGRYVREQGALSLMDALAKMTLLPARKLEQSVPDMRLRGRLQPGMIADITVFDAKRVIDRATYRQPMQPSAGIAHVLVAGTAVVENYRFQEQRFPGRAIKQRSRQLAQAGVPGGAARSDPMEADLQQVLDAALAAPTARYRGAVLRVAAGDQAWSVASGLSDIRTQAKMEPHERFRCGSIIKPFIATVVLQLIEEGKLSLDDRLPDLLPRRYWEGFEYAADITLEMLLSHRSGIANWTDGDIRAVVYPQPEKIWRAGELLDRAVKLGTRFKPGAAYAYNNTGYTLLGLIIEQATGSSWRQNIRERILQPLALQDTELPEPGDRKARPRHARGYDFVDGREQDVTDVDPSMAGSAGGHALVSSTTDLITFMRALLAGRLFKQPQTLAAMLHMRGIGAAPDRSGSTATRSGYGLGIAEYGLADGSSAYGHTGVAAGFGTLVVHIPARNVSVSAMITQGDNAPLRELLMSVLKTVEQHRGANTSAGKDLPP